MLAEAAASEEAPNMRTADKLKDSVDIIAKIKTLPALETFDERDLKELLRISKIVRYNPGELIADDRPQAVSENPHVIEAYLGKGVTVA